MKNAFAPQYDSIWCGANSNFDYCSQLASPIFANHALDYEKILIQHSGMLLQSRGALPWIVPEDSLLQHVWEIIGPDIGQFAFSTTMDSDIFSLSTCTLHNCLSSYLVFVLLGSIPQCFFCLVYVSLLYTTFRTKMVSMNFMETEWARVEHF